MTYSRQDLHDGIRQSLRELDLVCQKYPPSKGELDDASEFPEGTTPDDLARAVMQPVMVKHILRPKR